VISYFQAVVIGLFQGVTELVPISSLGRSVLLPDLFGWHRPCGSSSATSNAACSLGRIAL
jgi:undecaprenyl pyrophosphate phosphatase UppP